MKLHVYVYTAILLYTYQTHAMNTLTRRLQLKPIAPHGKYFVRRVHSKNLNDASHIVQMVTKRDIKGLLKLYATNPSAFHATSEGITPLHYAATCPDSLTPIEILIAAGTPIDAQTKEGDTALHLAAQNNNVPAIQALLRNKAATDITNKAGKTALASSKLKIDDLLAD